MWMSASRLKDTTSVFCDPDNLRLQMLRRGGEVAQHESPTRFTGSLPSSHTYTVRRQPGGRCAARTACAVVRICSNGAQVRAGFAECAVKILVSLPTSTYAGTQVHDWRCFAGAIAHHFWCLPVAGQQHAHVVVV